MLLRIGAPAIGITGRMVRVLISRDILILNLSSVISIHSFLRFFADYV